MQDSDDCGINDFVFTDSGTDSGSDTSADSDEIDELSPFYQFQKLQNPHTDSFTIQVPSSFPFPSPFASLSSPFSPSPRLPFPRSLHSYFSLPLPSSCASLSISLPLGLSPPFPILPIASQSTPLHISFSHPLQGSLSSIFAKRVTGDWVGWWGK